MRTANRNSLFLRTFGALPHGARTTRSCDVSTQKEPADFRGCGGYRNRDDAPVMVRGELRPQRS
jgi:hypothetical protein